MPGNIIMPGHWTVPRRRGPLGSYDPWFQTDHQANIIKYFGAPAEELYLPGEPASGNIVGKIAGNVLSPVTTPLYRQTLSGTHLGAGFDVGTLDSFDAANATVHDYAGTFAILSVIRFVSLGSRRQALGKRDTDAPNYGYELAPGTVDMLATFDGADGASTPAVSHDGDTSSAHYWLMWMGASACGLTSDYGESTGTVRACGTTGTFALGQTRTTANGITLGPTVIFSGAAAETVIAARATTLPAWWAEATA